MGSHKANHGQNYRRMCSEDGIEGPCSYCAAACCFCLCPECLPCAHANTAKQVGMGNCFLNYLCCECCPFFWGCQVLRVRQKIREELKLPQQSCFADCLKAWFCLGCMILENRQTIKANKIDLSSKGKFNVADTLVGAIVNQPK